MSTALVTGASGGIGKEVARQLLEQGFEVLVAGRDPAKVDAAVAELGGAARPLLLDVTDDASIAAAASAVPDLDVLVNNAGITDSGGDVASTSLDEFRRVYDTDLFGLVAVTRAFLPALRRSARPRIVNVSSGSGSLALSTQHPAYRTWKGASIAYRSAKAAVNAVTLLAAQALEEDGFKVNALSPGLRRTNLNGRTADSGGDPAEAAAGAVRLALLADDGPTGGLFDWDGVPQPW